MGETCVGGVNAGERESLGLNIAEFQTYFERMIATFFSFVSEMLTRMKKYVKG